MRNKGSKGLSVEVFNGNFEKAFRQWRKKVQKSGVIQEVRDRQCYIKPNEKRRLAKKAAVREERKNAQSGQPKRLY